MFFRISLGENFPTIWANIGSENDDATGLKIERLQLRNSLNVLHLKNSDLESSIKFYLDNKNNWYTRYGNNVSQEYILKNFVRDKLC